ncbi:inositol monophosphatase family protein [Litorimonas sp. WD9-15]|uniref:inositol monophosphatase family protein n=1 Tax=Litorimonas sp. WD9-15 TaxID=3418716 RepID=UPI003D061BCD
MTISKDIQARLTHLHTLSQIAREITLPLFADPKGVENKASGSDYDPVTQADIDAEKALRKSIRATFPDDSIEGEELPDHVGKNDFSWTLDPIDGTRGFVAGVPVWSTLIALSHKNKAVLGMIDLPALNKRYMGHIDETTSKSWLEEDGTKTDLKTSPCAEIRDGILGCTAPFGMFKPGELAAFKIIGSGTRFMRLGLDALGYGLLAEGRMDIIVEAGMKPCDVRALIPIVEGAGGKLTNWHGGSAADGGRVVAVGDAGLLPELYTYLGRALD